MHFSQIQPEETKIIFFLLLSQIREGEKKGRSLLRISEMNKENEIIKGQEQRRAPMPCFSFFLFIPLSFFLHFPFLRGHRCPSFFSSSFRLSRQPVISVPLLSFSFFIKQKEKERPSSMSFLSRFFSASFQGQKKDSQHSASSA